MFYMCKCFTYVNCKWFTYENVYTVYRYSELCDRIYTHMAKGLLQFSIPAKHDTNLVPRMGKEFRWNTCFNLPACNYPTFSLQNRNISVNTSVLLIKDGPFWSSGLTCWVLHVCSVAIGLPIFQPYLSPAFTLDSCWVSSWRQNHLRTHQLKPNNSTEHVEST